MLRRARHLRDRRTRGAELHLTQRLGGECIVKVTRNRLNLRSGGIVAIDLGGSETHLFDAETGRRI